MKIIRHNVKPAAAYLPVDWDRKIGRSWSGVLDPVLRSEYMNHLMFYLKELYKCNPHVYPKDPGDVFRAFTLCNWTQLKVVIFGNEPVPYIHSNGLAFGSYEKETGPYSKDLIEIEKIVAEHVYYGNTTVFDKTLESWAEQGVLLLNTSLVAERGWVGSQTVMFKEFMRQVVQKIDDEKAGVIFVFTDKRQHWLKKYIDETYNTILEVDGITSDPELFDDINRILIDSDGQGADIKW